MPKRKGHHKKHLHHLGVHHKSHAAHKHGHHHANHAAIHGHFHEGSPDHHNGKGGGIVLPGLAKGYG